MSVQIEMRAAWDLHEGLVLGTACTFYRHYGGDLEEIKADAYFHFVAACTDYSGRSPLSYWIHKRVLWGLLAERKHLLMRLRHEAEVAKWRAVEYRQRHNIDWQDELSDDAREIVKAAIKPPPDLQLMQPERRYKPLSRKVLRRFFQDCGWTQSRVRKAFLEIEKVIA